eukprot:1143120-Pelagomonas_calceolata.AAC.1
MNAWAMRKHTDVAPLPEPAPLAQAYNERMRHAQTRTHHKVASALLAEAQASLYMHTLALRCPMKLSESVVSWPHKILPLQRKEQ